MIEPLKIEYSHKNIEFSPTCVEIIRINDEITTSKVDVILATVINELIEAVNRTEIMVEALDKVITVIRQNEYFRRNIVDPKDDTPGWNSYRNEIEGRIHGNT